MPAPLREKRVACCGRVEHLDLRRGDELTVEPASRTAVRNDRVIAELPERRGRPLEIVRRLRHESDQRLALLRVRLDDVGMRLHALGKRLAARVQDDLRAGLLRRLDEIPVGVDRPILRQRTGENDDIGCGDGALAVAVAERAGLGGRDGEDAVATQDVVILSGSLPKDYPSDAYRHLVETAKKAGAKVVLDASGKALAEGVKAHPDVIKPNAEECEPLIGFVPKTPEDFRKATTALKAFCDYPIISDGGAGCWFDGEFVPAPKVEVLDTTAAGDTLLAEWCFQFFTSGQESASPLALRLAVAAGSAACTMPGGEPPDVALVEKLAGEVA